MMMKIAITLVKYFISRAENEFLKSAIELARAFSWSVFVVVVKFSNDLPSN